MNTRVPAPLDSPTITSRLDDHEAMIIDVLRRLMDLIDPPPSGPSRTRAFVLRPRQNAPSLSALSPMKFRSFLAALLFGFLSLAPLSAQEVAPAPSAAQADLKALIAKISAKLRNGSPTAATLAPEIAEFDALLAKYPEKNEDSAQIAFWKATLYLQVLGDEETAKSQLTALAANFPGTNTAANAERVLASLSPEAKAKAAAEEAVAEAKVAALVGQAAPEITFTWSTKPDLKHLSDLKGQIVVLDFWATWCGPCIRSFPKVREEVAHFKGSPVKFLGVTSLQGRVHGIEPKPIDTKDNPQKEYDLMPEFMKKKEMTWDVAFSEQNVFNEDYGIRGIPFVAIVDPKGVVRHAGINPLDPEADIAGKVTALLQEFNLPLPAAKPAASE